MNELIIEKTENGIYKMLDLSELPKKKRGSKEAVIWKETNNHEAKYNYLGNIGILHVTYAGYDKNKKQLVKVRINSKEKILFADNLKKIKIGAFFYKKIPTYLHKYIYDEKDTVYNAGTHKKIKCVCPGCKTTRMVAVQQLSARGFNCLKCRTQESFPERAVRIILEQNSIEYIQQYSPLGLSNRKFDFYLPKTSTFLEVHGEQHYKPCFGEKAFKKVMKSDGEKRQFCHKNNFKLIEMNASKSDIKFLIDSLLDVTGWSPKCLDSLLKEAYGEINMERNSEIINSYLKGRTTCEIGKIYGLSDTAIANILKNHGVKMRSGGSPKRKIVCVNTLSVYPYISKAASLTRINRKTICNNLRERTKSAGKHPVTGEKLKWMYYEDYIEKYGTEGLTEYMEDEIHNETNDLKVSS